VLVLIFSAIVGSAVADAQPVRVGFPQLNGGQTPLWTISEVKLDRKYGIEVRPVYIPGGARLTQTVVSKDVDIALTGGAVINAILGGADLVFVGVAVPTYAFSLYARSDVKAVPELSAPTTLMACRLGYKELVNIASLNLPYTFTGMAVSRTLTKQNPDLVKSFLKAYVEAIKVVKERPDIAKQALSRHFGAKDPDIVEEAYRSFVPLFPRIPYVNEDGVREVLSDTDHPKAASADPKAFYDNSFLNELEKSGIVKELYGQR
jgi:ABC-type nitrate/sulfonate/bicarbonate transport system substrate-binding protein